VTASLGILVAKSLGLFILTALSGILGCYLPFLWLRKGASPWVLLPVAVSLPLFAWLLTLHPMSAGRTYAAYSGVYVFTALCCLWAVGVQRPDHRYLLGGGVDHDRHAHPRLRHRVS
jgi:small multidrug resistance family-3 protein